ncbi:hypothetical protein K502DRAFT_333200 [Neoconidiobolus thromboides FSU 785]|nr:hypothetical protein K502DRAFT_333200 [Neoconidiobolus thromboides FSU 785]
MFPTTISDGIANDSNSSVQFQYFNNQLLLVYANENRVIIKSWEGETIQIIPLRLEIRSLAFSDRNGQLAVTQDSEVYIFKFESMEEKKFHWNLVTKIHYFNQIIQVSWFNNDHLLIGSDSDEFICYWNENCSSNIFIADISSDGQWLALTHNNDRVVKIWNIKSNRQYYYLKHPRTVLSLSWYQHNNNGDNVPILFTTCYDEIFRCWTFNNNCFYLSTTLDPSQWSINNKNNNCSNTASEIINKNVINKDLTKDHQLITNNQLNLIPSFHWINPIIIKELAYLEINRIKNQQSEIIGEVELNYLIQIYNLTPLLIFKFEQDGSLIIWKLEGLENIINSAPKIKVLSKISKIIHFNQNQSLLFKKWFININPLSLKFKGNKNK